MKRVQPVPPAAAPAGARPSPLLKVAIMLLVPMLVGAIVACDNGSGAQSTPTTAARAPYQGSPEGKPPNLGAPVPDPKDIFETKPSGQLPSYAASAPANVQAMYKGAVANYDAFSHIPCYCGCAIYTTAHTSLASCFVKQMTSGGDVTFTNHSMSCDLCQTAAQMTIDGLANGTPLKDVRTAIFNKLKYTGIWTDTPPVQ